MRSIFCSINKLHRTTNLADITDKPFIRDKLLKRLQHIEPTSPIEQYRKNQILNKLKKYSK
jgi:hypothetical protein